ncbi:Predicted protein tyrosine phosphatase [Faunimonas pinastri]|uniref:Tyrosine specific protein phosphatases domain-containing protein n=1 Tax=Faunimonas pinastri TaxID=1855383 RepID=A0A1H8ZWA7_9HYPH|nr:tyrosine phosphatase family protein [Faunimonas pinastri]SEP68664.1 Predicted protein tyrosine phosphatase [Faunimonas pinastri]
MSAIYVCPLGRVADLVKETGASHIVTLINRETLKDVPRAVPKENHLLLGFNDIVEAMDGMILPAEEHVRELLDFIERWDRKAPVVIHCWAGISRSTASAYIAYCALRPDLDERVVAARLRQRSPQATPNALLVAHADRLLGRDGRMIAAIESIGRGASAFEGTVFSLALDEA